jgi:hypothetical protein
MPGLIRGVARTAVVAGTATAVSNRVSRRQAGRWAAQDQQQAYQAQAQPAPGPAAEDDTNQKIAQLRELGELKAQGVLTQSEFDAQKAQILGSR